MVNHNTAKEVLAEMFVTGQSAADIVQAKGLAQISDEAAIVDAVAQVLGDNAEQISLYLQGKEQLRGWFVGQVMRAMKGKANPARVNEVLDRQLAKFKAESS
jgi:aspartyl-tRNA(Asn)/glutamyl-tRNA(Gln) amidotransferase subunit B